MVSASAAVPAAEFTASAPFQLDEGAQDLGSELARLLARGQILPARRGGDGEAGGTGSPSRVISARFAPLPPSRSAISRPPSANGYTYRVMTFTLRVGSGVRDHGDGRAGVVEHGVRDRPEATAEPGFAFSSAHDGQSGVR